MNWTSLLTRLAPPILVTTFLAMAFGIGLPTLLLVITGITVGVTTSELVMPWLGRLTARALARGKIVDATYEAYVITSQDAVGRLREELVQVEGELPRVLERENIHVSSTKPIDNGVAIEGGMTGGYSITGSITLAPGTARGQGRVVISLTAHSIPYKDLGRVLHTLFLASIGGNRAIRDILHEHGVSPMIIKSRVVITTRGRPALLDHVPRGFSGLTLTRVFGAKEYRASISYDSTNHTGYLIIDGPWGYVEEIARDLLPLYT